MLAELNTLIGVLSKVLLLARDSGKCYQDRVIVLVAVLKISGTRENGTHHIGGQQRLRERSHKHILASLCLLQTYSRDLEDASGTKTHVCSPNRGLRIRI